VRLRVGSDLHLEFQTDRGRALVGALTSGDFDVLVVAGDLTDAKGLAAALSMLAEATKKPIVYVHGNHEFYGSDRESVLATTRAATIAYRHLYCLDGHAISIDGQRFLGTPLWFAESDAPKWALNDFTQIAGFESWVYKENQLARAFLNREVRSGDVVVTHHLPHPDSVHPKYARSALNPFFLCDVSDVIREEQPALWVHGHTHERCDYRIRGTRVICNPFGYAGYEETGFDPACTMEIP
jgi:Icc-related predicted phosphoesterase